MAYTIEQTNRDVVTLRHTVAAGFTSNGDAHQGRRGRTGWSSGTIAGSMGGWILT